MDWEQCVEGKGTRSGKKKEMVCRDGLFTSGPPTPRAAQQPDDLRLRYSSVFNGHLFRIEKSRKNISDALLSLLEALPYWIPEWLCTAEGRTLRLYDPKGSQQSDALPFR